MRRKSSLNGIDYHEALGIRPGGFGKAFDGNPAVVVKSAFVYKIGGFLAALRNDLVAAEGVGGPSQHVQRKFSKGGHCLWLNSSPIFSCSNHMRRRAAMHI